MAGGNWNQISRLNYYLEKNFLSTPEMVLEVSFIVNQRHNVVVIG